MARDTCQGSRPSQLPPRESCRPAEDTRGSAPVASTRRVLRGEESTNQGVGSEESTTDTPAALINPPFPRANFAPHPSVPPRAHLKAARPLKVKRTARSGRAGSTQAGRVSGRGEGGTAATRGWTARPPPPPTPPKYRIQYDSTRQYDMNARTGVIRGGVGPPLNRFAWGTQPQNASVVVAWRGGYHHQRV